MAISALDQYLASVKQRIQIVKTAARTSVALIPFSVFELAGNPGSGTLAGTSTANGVVPTDVTAGCPIINFSSGVGYISRIETYSSVLCRLMLWDMLFKAGAYAFTGATTTLNTQPSYLGRCPDGIGNNCQIWIEVSTAFVTGTAWQVRITYTNQSGTTGCTSVISVAAAAAALTLGKMFQVALQAGDSGVQKIESVIVTNGGTLMTAGAFNVLVLRPLFGARIAVANSGQVYDFLSTGMPTIYLDSAFILTVQADSTSTGLPDVTIELASA